VQESFGVNEYLMKGKALMVAASVARSLLWSGIGAEGIYIYIYIHTYIIYI